MMHNSFCGQETNRLMLLRILQVLHADSSQRGIFVGHLKLLFWI